MPSKIEQEFVRNLENFTDALENLVELMKKQNKKGGSGTNSLSSGMDGTRMKAITEDIKTLVKTTAKIDSRTKEILHEVKAARKAKEGGIFEKSGDKQNKKKVVDGVKLILLIAVGVLAIGMAFKLVGNVDPMSVIALSIGIYTIAMVFEKLTTIKNLTTKKALLVSGVLIILSFAIMASSFFLRWTAPISLITAFSIVAVGATVGIAAYFLLKAFHKIDLTKPKVLKSLFLMPLILPIIALAIVLSSFILTLTQPITLAQGLTAIAVGLILGVTAYLLLKGLKGQDLSKPQTIKSILLLPLLLPMIAASIALSSLVLSLTQPITWQQGLSALVVGGILGLAAYLILKAIKGQDLGNPQTIKSVFSITKLLPLIALGIVLSSIVLQAFVPLKNPLKMLGSVLVMSIMMVPAFAMIWAINKFKISSTDILKGAISMILVSGALVLSSLILQGFKPIQNPMQMLLGSLAMSGAILTFFPTIYLINKFNISVADILKGALAILIISAVIVATSYILGVGKYDSYPPLMWTLGAGVAVLSFGLFTLGLGLAITASGGIGLPGIALGALGVLMVAATIVATSYILGAGKYSGYPPMEWVKSVGLSMLIFVPAMIIAGVGIVGIALGVPAMLLVAYTITKVAEILAKGDYKGGPTLSWALGVGILIPVFTAALLVLGTVGLLAGPALLVGAALLLGVSEAIVASSKILSGGTYTGGPTKEWAEGVGISIGAFANALDVAMNAGKSLMQSIFGGGGITPEQFVSFIETVSKGIVGAANLFNGVTWDGAPPETWAKGVGGAIGGFSQALAVVNQTGGWFKDSMTGDQFAEFIKSVAKGIKAAAAEFKGDENTYTGGPDETWSERIGKSISVFTNALSSVTQSDMDGDDLVSFIRNIGWSMNFLANKFTESDFTKYPSMDWLKSLAGMTNIILFIGRNIDDVKIEAVNNFADAVKNLARSFASLNEVGLNKLSNLTSNLKLLAVVDTTQLDMVVKSLGANAGAIQNAVNVVSGNSQQQQTSTIDSMKDMIKSIVGPRTEQNKISTTKKEEHIGIKVDNKDITDRLDKIIEKMVHISDIIIKKDKYKDISQTEGT